MCFQSSNSSPPECVEVPLAILPSPTLAPHTVEQFLKLPAMFLSDERGNFLKPWATPSSPVSAGPAANEDPFHPPLPKLPSTLAVLHASASYAGTLTEIVDRVVGPTVAAFDSKRTELERRIVELKAEKARLEKGEKLEDEEMMDWPPLRAVPSGPSPGPPPSELQQTRLTPEPPPPRGLGIADTNLEAPRYSSSSEPPQRYSPEPPRQLVPPMVPVAAAAVPSWQKPMPAITPPSLEVQSTTSAARAVSPKPVPPPRVAVPPPSQSGSGGSGGSPPSQVTAASATAPAQAQGPAAQLKGPPPPAPPRTTVPPPSSSASASQQPARPPSESGSPPSQTQIHPQPMGQPSPFYQAGYTPTAPPPSGVPPYVPAYGQRPAGDQPTPAPPSQNKPAPSAPPQSLMPQDERQQKDQKPSFLRRFSPSRS